MADRFARRTFLKFMVAGVGAASRRALAADRPAGKTTYTYKKVGALSNQADVFGATECEPRPVALWLHGGALIMGNRGSIHPALRDARVKAGYVVSIDYRLAQGRTPLDR